MATEGKSDYSLWLSPESSETVLSDLIIDLSRRVDPPTLPFAPHATLFSDSLIGTQATLEDIREGVERAIRDSRVNKVTCKFEKLEAGKLFYQCVYIKLVKDERGSNGLLELHRSLRRAFGDHKDPEGESYMPHVSLVYGDLDLPTKEGLIQGMLSKGEAEVISEDGGVKVLDLVEFETTQVLVVRTAGPSDSWQIVDSIPMAGSKIAHEEL